MTIRSRSEDAAGKVTDALSLSLSEEQTKELVMIIERAVIDAMVEANQRCTQVAKDCCSADRDMAHKIADEIERSHKALIANLSAMR